MYLVKTGDHVVVVDSVGRCHNGLVTAVWGDPEKNPATSINAVIVSDNPDMNDTYGRQINRQYTSLGHMSNQAAHGMYWRGPNEEPRPTENPANLNR